MRRQGKLLGVLLLWAGAGWWCLSGGGPAAWFLCFFLGAVAIASLPPAFFALRGTKAERLLLQAPVAVLAGGEPLEIELRLRRGTRFPCVWLSVTDCWEKESGGSEAYAYRTLLFPWLRREVTCRYRVHRLPRGTYRFRHVLLETGDVFGVATKRKRIELPGKLVVMPRPLPLAGIDMPGAPGEDRPVRGWLSRAAVPADAVRAYAPGDPPSRIHWRSTARRGELMTRGEAPAETGRLLVYLDASAEAYRRHLPAPLFEKSVQLAAGMLQFAAERGVAAGLSCNGAHPLHVPPAHSPADMLRMAQALAALGPDGGEPLSGLLARDADTAQESPGSVVCITPLLDAAMVEAVGRLCACKRRVMVVYVHPCAALPHSEREWREALAGLGAAFVPVSYPKAEWEVLPYADDISPGSGAGA